LSFYLVKFIFVYFGANTIIIIVLLHHFVVTIQILLLHLALPPLSHSTLLHPNYYQFNLSHLDFVDPNLQEQFVFVVCL